MMDTQRAALEVNGRLIGPSVRFAGVSTDTRSVEAGDLFVALRGERFDGHDFVAQAFAGGAVAALVNEVRAEALTGPRVAVDDTLRALGRLAQRWRTRFAIPVVGVVGSNGKTTVKEMIASIFRASVGDAHVLATRGNLNNAIGLPLTVLRLRDDHRLAVLELGMNHRGETRELAAIAQPTIAVITNAQREHQEFMRSVADVAEEHADLIRALDASGTAVINADDAHASVWRAAASARKRIEFGLENRADVHATFVAHRDRSELAIATPRGRVDVLLGVPGRHMVVNALAATAVALAADIALDAVRAGLTAFRAVDGRLVARSMPGGTVVIDDSYNANPDSVRAAIDVLAAAPGQKWLVLGDMGEVGEQGPAFHREIGAYAKRAGIDRLLASGELMAEAVQAFGTGAEHVDSVEELAQRVASTVRAGVTVLIKGSRFMRMERVVAALTGSPGSAH